MSSPFLPPATLWSSACPHFLAGPLLRVRQSYGATAAMPLGSPLSNLQRRLLFSGIASCIHRVASRELTYCIRHVGCLPLAVHVDMISTLKARPIRPPLSVRHAPLVVGITPGSAPGSGQRHQTPQTCWRCREEKKNARGAEAYSDKLFCVEQKSRVNPIRSCRLRRL
jgi:hypothetical protein